MNLADVEEFPTRIASAKFSGQRHDNGEHAAKMKVRVVVFHDYPDWPRLPMGYSGPKPVDPRYTVVIDDHTRDVVFSVLTWGREGDAKNTSSGTLGGSNPPAYLPQESILDLSNPSDLPLNYPWSASEQTQRDIAIERRDANLLPECTGHYFAWRTQREKGERQRGGQNLPQEAFGRARVAKVLQIGWSSARRAGQAWLLGATKPQQLGPTEMAWRPLQLRFRKPHSVSQTIKG